MSGWYVVNTLPHQEARAETNLLQQGYRAWLPVFKRSRRHARRIDTILAPIFPSYLFVELDLDRESWLPINGTFGVRRLICEGAKPAALPATFVSSSRQTVSEDGLFSFAEPDMRPGQKVRIISGPFVDCIGTLLQLCSKDRV